MPPSSIDVINVMHHISVGGGVVTHTLKVANAIQERGHHVSFVTLPSRMKDPASKDMTGGINIAHASSRLDLPVVLAPIALGRKATEVAKKVDAPVIQAFDPIITGPAALQAKRALGTPVAIRLGTNNQAHHKFQFQQLETHSMQERLKSVSKSCILLPAFSILERIVLNLADIVVTNCRYLKSIYVPHVVNSRNVIVIKNGVDTTKFSPKGSKGRWGSDHFWLLYIGRIEKRKGLEILLKAMPSILNACPNAKLRVVGRALSTAYALHLDRLTKELSIDTKVDFVGPISNERVPEIMRAADVLTFPSTTGGTEVEGLPNTILESMACGLPIVATKVCGVPEVITNRETGLLVTPGSAKEMSDGIIELVDSIEYRKELGRNARNYVTRHHTITSVAMKYLKLYQRLADAHS